MSERYDIPSEEMTLEQARSAVRELRKKVAEQFANMQNEWVSVKDRLPEILEEVFVLILPEEWDITYDIGYINTAGYWETVWHDSREPQKAQTDFITHWMPIPKLPSDYEDADHIIDDLIKKWGHKTKCCKCGREFEIAYSTDVMCPECRHKIYSLWLKRSEKKPELHFYFEENNNET